MLIYSFCFEFHSPNGYEKKIGLYPKLLLNIAIDLLLYKLSDTLKTLNIDCIRERLSLRPLLNWTKKDIFYYMEKNKLPQHPLFEKGYSTVGDWHSSDADNNNSKGRSTRFGGLSEECGIHINKTT